MTDTPVTNTSGAGLSVASFIITVVALAFAIAMMIIKFANIITDSLTLRILWWVAFGVMVVGLILNMFASKKAGRNRRLVLIGSFLGLATAIILIISLFVK